MKSSFWSDSEKIQQQSSSQLPSNQPPPDPSPTQSEDVETCFQELISKLEQDPVLDFSFEQPQKFGKYEIRKWLSNRGQAIVASAFDHDLQRQVIIKIYKHSFCDQQKARLLEEGRLLTEVDSPFIARCYHVDEIDGTLFLVLENIPGKNLYEYKRDRPMTIREAHRIVADLAKGLSQIHERGLLHLDLKPHNVMISDSGDVKLIDFGLAQRQSDVRSDSISGTPGFMPIEMAQKNVEQINTSTDVFGLAGIWFFLLTGSAPVLMESADKMDHRSEPRSSLTNLEILNQQAIGQRRRSFLKSCLLDQSESRPSLPELQRMVSRNMPTNIAVPIAILFACATGYLLTNHSFGPLFKSPNSVAKSDAVTEHGQREFPEKITLKSASVNARPIRPSDFISSFDMELETKGSILKKAIRWLDVNECLAPQTVNSDLTSISFFESVDYETDLLNPVASHELAWMQDGIKLDSKRPFHVRVVPRSKAEFPESVCHVAIYHLTQDRETSQWSSCILTNSRMSNVVYATEFNTQYFQFTEDDSGLSYIAIIVAPDRFTPPLGKQAIKRSPSKDRSGKFSFYLVPVRRSK